MKTIILAILVLSLLIPVIGCKPKVVQAAYDDTAVRTAITETKNSTDAGFADAKERLARIEAALLKLEKPTVSAVPVAATVVKKVVKKKYRKHKRARKVCVQHVGTVQ